MAAESTTKSRRARSRDDGQYEKSNWNLFLERKLSVEPPLGVYEHRLADAIARNTLGYNRLTRAVGQTTLRIEADLDGRSFERARQGLVDKGLIRYDTPAGTAAPSTRSRSPRTTPRTTRGRSSSRTDPRSPARNGSRTSAPLPSGTY